MSLKIVALNRCHLVNIAVSVALTPAATRICWTKGIHLPNQENDHALTAKRFIAIYSLSLSLSPLLSQQALAWK
jgi:hypothetical protein